MDRRLIIIPDEDVLDVPIYECNCIDSHGIDLKKFSDKHQLGLTFDSVDDRGCNFYSFKWAPAIASLNHVVILIDNFTIIYLPNTLSKKQFTYLDNFKNNLPTDVEYFGFFYQEESKFKSVEEKFRLTGEERYRLFCEKIEEIKRIDKSVFLRLNLTK